MKDYGLTRICREKDIVFVDTSAVSLHDNLSRNERINRGILCRSRSVDLREVIIFYKCFDHQVRLTNKLWFTGGVAYEFEKSLTTLPYYEKPSQLWKRFAKVHRKTKNDAKRFLFNPTKEEAEEMDYMKKTFYFLVDELGLSNTDYDLALTANTLAGFNSYIGLLSYDFALLEASRRIAVSLKQDDRFQGYFFQRGIFIPYTEKYRKRKTRLKSPSHSLAKIKTKQGALAVTSH